MHAVTAAVGDGLGLAVGLGLVGEGDGKVGLAISAGQFTGCCEGHDRACAVLTCVSVCVLLTQA